uniref:Uncharacterized protein n=1 Tax=Romanomermis culicivorax TaxID=13658 RepID=A0A915IS04_ROMCU
MINAAVGVLVNAALLEIVKSISMTLKRLKGLTENLHPAIIPRQLEHFAEAKIYLKNRVKPGAQQPMRPAAICLSYLFYRCFSSICILILVVGGTFLHSCLKRGWSKEILNTSANYFAFSQFH